MGAGADQLPFTLQVKVRLPSWLGAGEEEAGGIGYPWVARNALPTTISVTNVTTVAVVKAVANSFNIGNPATGCVLRPY